ncbi:trifunctional dihydropteroate synthetase [Ceratobasidium sp. 423]|nr:trifunctional dihydropteroate synthetase [Ceratobasidium sp. 423]
MASSGASRPDLIIVDGLSIHTTLGASHWPRPGVEQKLQPLVLSITVPLSLAQSGTVDNLDESVSYGSICKVVEACASEKGKYSSVESLSSGIAAACFGAFKSVHEVQSVIEKQRALLHAKGAGVKSVRLREGAKSQTYFVRDLELSTIIGLHPWERVEKQLVRINLEWTLAPNVALPPAGFDFRNLIARVSDFTLASSYQTVESLAAAIAQVALQAGQHLDEITVRVGKPSALMMANTAAVQITRTLADFGLSRSSLSNALDFAPPEGQHIAILALGSNIGDRFVNIEKGLQALEKAGVKVVDTSYLYETKAMYHEDQASFINGVCAISTSLNPTELITLLKRVETEVGRTPTFRNGPRVVDLDILFYDDLLVDIAEGEFPLQIPHPRIQEREFVLRPLADIIPEYTHLSEQKSIRALLSALPTTDYPMHRVMPLIPTAHPNASAEKQHPYWTWGSRTYLMATLNTTPDSFSDGGDNVHTPDAPQDSPALQYVRKSLSQGADILDIGGYSTRPGAAPVSPEVEISRVVPVVRAIREAGIQVPISIDTFRADVARAALTAGANVINDVRAGRGEYATSEFSQSESMFAVAHEFGCPIVLMHSREQASEDTSYALGTLDGVRKELGIQVAAALGSGIRRWNIIADPGYGFSKSVTGNVELVRNLNRLVDPGAESGRALRNLPILAGTSRKSYLGSILARSSDGQDAGPVPAKEREWATAAAVTACIQAGADVVRVHNVEAMRDVVAVADRIWRARDE